MKTATLETEITKGYVMVFVPLFDSDGMQRTIDFPYSGKTIMGNGRYHWTAKPYLTEARKEARKALSGQSR